MNAPTAKAEYSDLPSEADGRREFLLDIFGQHLFSLRNQLTARLRHYVEQEEARRQMGSIPSAPFAAVAGLDGAGREAALGLAREAVDRYMQLVLGLLQSSGQSLRVGQEHAIRYRLYAEVIGVEDYDTVLADSLINREAEKALADYFGRWLNRHGDHQ
jgi:hypothetical protein